MLKARSGRTSAFGYLNVPLDLLKEEISACLRRCHRKVKQWETPTIGAYPIDRLRRQMAHAMRLDVVFTKKAMKSTNESGISYWERTPVWKVAQRAHYVKALKLSSLLREIVTYGWKAKIVHDLARLSMNIWTMSLRHFSGLCRKILSKIVAVLRTERSSPDPLVRTGALTNNPTLCGRVNQHPLVKRKDGDLSGPRPKCLDLLVMKLTKHLRCSARGAV